jgi:hypothetical protein
MRPVVVLAALTAMLTACGTSKSAKQPVKVSDADYGRLEPGQTQVVDAAREDRGRARDELARAQLRLTQARHEDDLARADLEAAEGARIRAEARAAQSRESRAPEDIELARERANEAQLRKRAADAHMEYAKQLVEARQAEVAAAEQRVELQEARVEAAKLEALETAGVPAARKYLRSELTARVAEEQRDVERTSGQARALLQKAQDAERTWRDAQRQLQAQLESRPLG